MSSQVVLSIVILFLLVSCGKDPQKSGQLNFRKSWSKSFGGSNFDLGSSVVTTSDGGYVTLGYTYSRDRDVSGFRGGSIDVWVIKTDGAGNLLWQRCIGGTDEEQGTSIVQANDGSLLGVGWTRSNNGDIVTNYGAIDALLFKIDKNGNLLWVKTFGGTGDDYASSLIADRSGNYVIAGSTGDGQAWVCKVDSSGTILWEKKYGGSQTDQFRQIVASSDGEYIVAGLTSSNDGDVIGQQGGLEDAWVMKIDDSGNKIWQKTLGGTGADFALGLTPTQNGGCIVIGSTSSNDGDMAGTHGDMDVFVIALDNKGSKIWRQLFGGTGTEYASTILPARNGTYLLGGVTNSKDGAMSAPLGHDDSWIVQLDGTGRELGRQVVGGSSNDELLAMSAGLDGSFIFTGYSESKDGDVNVTPGDVSSDVWLLKFNVN